MRKLLKLSFTLLAVFLLLSCSEELKNNKKGQESRKNLESISKVEAINIANNFIDAQSLFPTTRGNLELKMVYSDLSEGQTRSNNQTPAYYVINVGNSGFILVSGSNLTAPVLGYSTESTFSPNNIPANMKYMLNAYKEQISIARNRHIEVTPEMAEMRLEFLTKQPTTRAKIKVRPLLGTIKWKQDPFYNDYCPKKCPVGCVATATAQIMRYWEYPKRGEGTYSYDTYLHGTLSFDYDYEINWDNMPKDSLIQANNDVAKLCYGIAVGLEMDFRKNGSGANTDDVPYVLKTHYKYSKNISRRYREFYDDEEWEDLIKKELDNKRPVQYSGRGKYGGHSFVCDGYTNNNFFHFNWGWGGVADGYFRTNALNPSSLGTGGGSGGYNSYQRIIANIEPASKKNGASENYGSYPEAKAKYSKATFIKKVSVSNIENTTKEGEGGYSYFFDKMVKLKKGNSYEISLTPGFHRSYYTEYWTAWVDYNGDNKFSKDEIIAKGTTKNKEPMVESFKVPANARGRNARMRVAMKWGAYPSVDETFKHGEVEDYSVKFE